MSRSLVYAVIAVLGCTVQAQQPTEPAHKTMLLTGCLQQGPDRSIFKLTDATLQAPASAVPGSASSRQEPVGTVGKVPEYELTTETGVDRSATQPADLNSYVGRRVEVTARPPEAAPSSPSASSDSPAKDLKAGEQKPPRLIVTAIKQVSSSCQ